MISSHNVNREACLHAAFPRVPPQMEGVDSSAKQHIETDLA